MMRLSTLWRVDSTIGEDETSPVASAIAAAWRLDEPPTFFRSSSNFVYAARLDGRRCFLRFADADEGASVGAVEAELAAMALAREHGIRTPEPVSADDGRWVVQTAVGDRTYVAVLLTALDGVELEVDEITVDQCREWGALIARLQRALAAAPPEIAAARPVHADPADDGVGLVHLDVELDNLRWAEDGPGVLDFDDLATHAYAVDVASALRDLTGDQGRTAALLDGYVAAGGRQLRGSMTAARRWLDEHTATKIDRSLDLEHLDDKPEWLHRLHARLVEIREELAARLEMWRRIAAHVAPGTPVETPEIENALLAEHPAAFSGLRVLDATSLEIFRVPGAGVDDEAFRRRFPGVTLIFRDGTGSRADARRTLDQVWVDREHWAERGVEITSSWTEVTGAAVIGISGAPTSEIVSALVSRYGPVEVVEAEEAVPL